jgi:hypothetical protein
VARRDAPIPHRAGKRLAGPVIEPLWPQGGDSASQGANKMQTQASNAWGPKPCGILTMTKKALRAVVTVSVNVEKLVLYLLIGLSALHCH